MRKYFGSHGDRCFFKLTKLPKTAKLVGKHKSFVDQEGETTGHKHLITSDAPFKVYEYGDKTLYLFEDKAVITHEEHHEITFKPGLYEVDQELEESAQTGLVQRVVD